jgi:hypothetical protein
MKSDRWTRAVLVGALALGLLAVTPLGGNALEPGGSFGDDDGSVHEASIEAIADVGITLGCNPPVNDLYCPNQSVTREQMASFLARALDLPAGLAVFSDTANSVHVASIAALADAGITLGCNPPVNNMYCPSKPVTRAQMATFLVRALGLPPALSSFGDTAGSIHEANIGALAAAGISVGCNPPANDLYCPNESVTRAQMATFLTRALNLTPLQPPPPLPDVSPSPLVVIGADNWLYISYSTDQECYPASVFNRVAAELSKVKAVVEASGRSLVYVVAPNKAGIYSETVPASEWDGSCADLNAQALRATLDAAADPSRVDLWTPFEQMASQRQIYHKHDTHWNAEGALIASEEIGRVAAPGVWDRLDLLASPASRQGDLATLIDVEWVIEYTDLTTKLSGVTPDVVDEGVVTAGSPVFTYNSPGHPELEPRPTVMLQDSFGLFAQSKLGPLFERATFITNPFPLPDDVRALMTAGEQIVFESVERNFAYFLIGGGTAGHLVSVFADDFDQVGVTFNRIGDEVEFALPPADPSALRYLVVDVDVAETVGLHRIVRVDIPESEGAWPDRLLPETSRYGFEIVGAPSTLRLPLPASVDVNSAFVVTVE